ncbi:hypothetical protein [Alkalihalobacillus sp. AL-G]|uniref:hypothetical protein n=1 Tax=Alkalihalobacillus sp. AL-G TaxID=2926399 RepID=UPI00272A4A1F|nr:hypothetical protein [Alkalihalobacillus sp. AL-G]WLD93274.1 hypothetical protein MOJ78_20140 [Alkalihalobacillus sp. AL-G]
MSIILMFMLTATVTPFVFMHLKKTVLAILQTVLLVGMWLYFFQAAFGVAPAVLSVLWIMFYAGLTVSFVAWVMMIIHMVETPAEHNRSYQ